MGTVQSPTHKRYRQLINKFIEIFEDIQYQEKEKIADAIAKLFAQSEN
jgi:hypothetical protein